MTDSVTDLLYSNTVDFTSKNMHHLHKSTNTSARLPLFLVLYSYSAEAHHSNTTIFPLLAISGLLFWNSAIFLLSFSFIERCKRDLTNGSLLLVFSMPPSVVYNFPPILLRSLREAAHVQQKTSSWLQVLIEKINFLITDFNFFHECIIKIKQQSRFFFLFINQIPRARIWRWCMNKPSHIQLSYMRDTDDIYFQNLHENLIKWDHINSFKKGCSFWTNISSCTWVAGFCFQLC